MVVKMDSSKTKKEESGAKYHVGNNLDVNLQLNQFECFVVGNKNIVAIEKNEGVLKVVGERCNVKVLSGHGKIYYTGNHGLVFLGESVKKDQVVLVGKHTKVLYSGQNGACEVEVPKAKKVYKCVKKVNINCINIDN